MSKSTNYQLATLLSQQTYSERMEMAKFIADAARDWAEENKSDALDDEYFATLLESWIDSELGDHP